MGGTVLAYYGKSATWLGLKGLIWKITLPQILDNSPKVSVEVIITIKFVDIATDVFSKEILKCCHTTRKY